MVNHGTITCTLSLFKTLPLNGFNPIRAKQRLHKRRKRVYESSPNRRKNQKLFIRTIHWNVENLVKIYHGIIEQLHPIGPRQMARLKEPYAEEKKGRQGYCSNLAWMKNGGPIPWNAIAICEKYKTSWQMEKLRKRLFGEPFKGPIIPFGAMVDFHPISTRDQSRLHRFGKNVFP